ncbi:hypothetical protein Pmani_038022 [Petrolisthes manimaculis]|uniref:Uncharacterized protein n=1 Tax=Petrolisthes manimaculis TaxID=1843537 RepID=A0AAE1NFC1_9EUCA|nr:hypothetical protein Pmani_038022 [Petrolisthes manimaculis]
MESEAGCEVVGWWGVHGMKVEGVEVWKKEERGDGGAGGDGGALEGRAASGVPSDSEQCSASLALTTHMDILHFLSLPSSLLSAISCVEVSYEEEYKANVTM